MPARLSSSLKRITIAAHLCLAAYLGWLALVMAGDLVDIGYPDLTLAAAACMAFILILAGALLSGTRNWSGGGSPFRLFWADLLALVAAPIALIPAVFEVDVFVLGEVALAIVCPLLLLIAIRGGPTAAVGRWEP